MSDVINGLYSTFMVSLTTQSTFTLHTTFTHTLIQHVLGCFPLHIHIHSYTNGHISRQRVVQCFAQGPFDMWAVGSRTTDPPTGRRLQLHLWCIA